MFRGIYLNILGHLFEYSGVERRDAVPPRSHYSVVSAAVQMIPVTIIL